LGGVAAYYKATLLCINWQIKDFDGNKMHGATEKKKREREREMEGEIRNTLKV
jgi:hypothetical protein